MIIKKHLSPRQVVLELLMLSAVLFFTSCTKKVLTTTKLNNEKQTLKTLFYAQNFDKEFKSTTDTTLNWIPDWDNPVVQTIWDDPIVQTVNESKYIFFSLYCYDTKQKKLIKTQELGSRTYLIVRNNEAFFRGTYHYVPNTKKNQTPTKAFLRNFTGTLILHRLQGEKDYVTDYKNGKISERIPAK